MDSRNRQMPNVEPKRRFIMSRVKHEGTKPEMIVRKYLFSQGFRYRINDRRYPGTPDIVLPKWRTMVFVHGCFWHQHDGCNSSRLPKTNTEFWSQKIRRNCERDKAEQQELTQLGWKVLVVWECELSTQAKRDERLPKLAAEIISQ